MELTRRSRPRTQAAPPPAAEEDSFDTTWSRRMGRRWWNTAGGSPGRRGDPEAIRARGEAERRSSGFLPKLAAGKPATQRQGAGSGARGAPIGVASA
jgi:hypothetical protein